MYNSIQLRNALSSKRTQIIRGKELEKFYTKRKYSILYLLHQFEALIRPNLNQANTIANIFQKSSNFRNMKSIIYLSFTTTIYSIIIP